jgi:hypothetical protein
MRALILITSGIGTILAAAPVQAQTYDPSYPVCLQSYSLGGGKIGCSYTSLAQCKPTENEVRRGNTTPVSRRLAAAQNVVEMALTDRGRASEYGFPSQ